MPAQRVPATLLLLAAAGALSLALMAPLGPDYVWDAAPSLHELVRGHLDGYFATQPQMGQLALLVRWPAAELAQALGGGSVWTAVALLWARRRREPLDALALLALVFLLRCVLDPWNHDYYHVPFLTALGCWEALRLRRAPVLTALASGVLWVVFARVAVPGPAIGADVLYLAWAVPMAGALAVTLFVHNRTDGSARRTRRRCPAIRKPAPGVGGRAPVAAGGAVLSGAARRP